MVWLAGVTKRPIQGHTDGPMRQYLGAVLHVNQSNGNLFNWVSGDHNMSCHFEVYKNGTAEQYLDTAVSSWCQESGNNSYLSIETEGYDTEPLTVAQLHTVANIMAQLSHAHSIPLQLAETVGQRGLGWHGMGGAAWGGHTGCPGALRKAQRSTIIETAHAILNGNEDDSMALSPQAVAQVEEAAKKAIAEFLTDPGHHQFGVYTIVKEAVAAELDARGIVKKTP